MRRRGLAPLFRARTGLLLDPYFSGTKLAWLLDRLPDARRRAAHGELAFGTVDTGLLWKLTAGQVHATDVSNASRPLLLNLHTGTWHDDLLRARRIPRAVLPAVRSSSKIYGHVQSIPVLRGVPIAGVAGDQPAALFGQACFRPGLAKNTYGTACFLLLHTGEKPVVSRHRLLTTVAWRLGPQGPLEYALEGGVFVGGAVVHWLRDGLGGVARSADIERLAARARDNGGVYRVPAFVGLGAPPWDATARGAIVGLTRGSSAAHVARAALESIAYQSANLLTAMEADAQLTLRALRVNGGATVNAALMQFPSDLLRVPVIRPRITETTALGAAFLAGLAVGFWKDRAELARLTRGDKIFLPRAPRHEKTPARLAPRRRARERVGAITPARRRPRVTSLPRFRRSHRAHALSLRRSPARADPRRDRRASPPTPSAPAPPASAPASAASPTPPVFLHRKLSR